MVIRYDKQKGMMGFPVGGKMKTMKFTLGMHIGK